MSEIVTTESMREAFAGILASYSLEREGRRERGERGTGPTLVVADVRVPQELWTVLRDLRTRHVTISGVVLLTRQMTGIAQIVEAISSELRQRVSAFDSDNIADIRRIVRAHQLGAQDQLIAAAKVVGKEIWVTGCNLQLYRVQKACVPALKELSDAQLSKFEINESGSRIHWAEGDVDLSLRDFRYFADEDYRREVDKETRASMKSYGKAIKKLRKKLKLRQQDIEKRTGLSEREVRRIEKGEVQPHSATLDKLAAAHEMNLSEYLSSLANYDG
ncbi:MAG: helix-turn-helix domain-containing protein [Myxococcota bacterium]